MCLEYYILQGIATFGAKMRDPFENTVVRGEKLRYNKKKQGVLLMTGMDIARKIQLPDVIFEAVYRVQPLDIALDPENPQNTLEALEAFAQQENGLRILRYFLDWGVKLKAQYDALGIPERVFWDGMKDIAIWAEDYYDKHGVPGFAEWGWVATTLCLKVFRLGRLQFEPMQLDTPIVCSGHTYPEGTAVLNVHIPAGEALDVSEVRASMDYAPEFFERYFQRRSALFLCHSWLMSPQLKELLQADSRIIQFQNLFSVYEVDQERQAEERVFGHLEENPAAYPEGTSLQKKMKAALLAGKCFGMGRGIRVIE